MDEIGAFEAKTKLGALLDRVEAGEEIVITRRGKAVARLVPSTRVLDFESGARRVGANPRPGGGAQPAVRLAGMEGSAR